MTAAKPAGEFRHPIQIVARRTGLTPDVIRVWERRYRAVDPHRSPTGRRLYSDLQIERLGLLRRATLAGRRIGDVARLPRQELTALIEVDVAAEAGLRNTERRRPGSEGSAYLEASLAALEDLDAGTLEGHLRRAALDLGAETAIQEVLTPQLEIVGKRWRDSTMQIHHEHLLTALVRSLLESLRSSLGATEAENEIVVTTPAGQLHEIGALTAAVIAAGANWRVTYLGSNLPAADIAAAVRSRGAPVLALSIIYPAADPQVNDELVELAASLPADVTVLVGGQAASSYASALDKLGAQHLSDYAGLRRRLEELGAATRTG